MPTQRTKSITISKRDQRLIVLAAEGMSLSNMGDCNAGMEEAYGGFYKSLQSLMNKACGFDPDFMSGPWEYIQGSLDISSPENYPTQIKFCLEREYVSVILE